MPGEQLPPVVATMEGDDTGFLDMLDRDVAALRAAAGEIDSLLAGLDLGAALADSLSTANLGSLNTDQIAQGLTESAAGIGDAIGAEIGHGLESSLGPAGTVAGDEIGQGIVEGASGTGDAVAAQLTSELQGGAERAGGQAGEILAESIVGPVSLLGADISAILSQGLRAGLPQVDAQVSDLMRQLPATVDADATYAGLQIGGALAAGLAGMGGAAAAAISGALAASAIGAAEQAGQAAGTSLIAGISDGAAGGAGRAADAVGRALEARLTDKMTESGAPVGDALLAGIQAGVQSGADAAAVKISESLQPPLDEQMTLLGQVAGDAFNAGLGDATGGSGGGSGASGGAGGAIVQEFAQAETEVEQGAQDLGQKAAGSFATGWQTRHGLIPFGGKLEPDELMSMGQQPDPFVPNPAGGANSWTRASAIGAQDAAKAAWQAYGDELAGLVIPPERFLALTDSGVQRWTEEVAAQAAASGEGFVQAFADAMTMGMAGIDFEALSGPQAAALGAAMRGTITQAAAQAESAAVTSGAALGESIVTGTQEAMGELPAVAAEEGDAAGSAFGRFFSGAASGLLLPFARNPELAAAREAAAADDGDAAGNAFGRFFSGAASALLVPFARDPERAAATEEGAAEEGDAAGSAFGRFFTGAASALLIPFARNPGMAAAAVEGGSEAGAAMAAGIDEALTAGLDATEVQLAAVFESIWQQGQLMSTNLAGAMTNALAGIETETSGFTADELAQWDAFFTALEERGTAAAYQLAVTMGSLQGKDLVGSGLTSVGNPMGTTGQEAQGLASDLGGVEKAATGATAGMGLMANMMYGPLGMAAFGLMTFWPQISSMFTNSAVSASVFTQAVQQDSQAVGDNTAVVIQSTLAKSDLSGISQQLGLSQAQLIEYAAGEANVQQQVTAAYNAKQTALSATSDNEQIHSKAQLESASSAQIESQNLAGQKAALDQVTSAVAQAIQQDAANSAALLAAEQTTQIYTAAVNALGQAQLLQTQQTKMTNQATAEFGSQVLFAESSVSYMNAAMQAAVATGRESALTSAYASVGLLNLGTSQSELNAQLSASETLYTEAQAGAQAYGTALTSLNGSVNTLLGSEASFTTTLSGLTTAVKANGDSLDVNTTKGAANITAITGIATAAQAASVAVYQNDVANGNASKAYQDATDKLAQEKEAFITAADKAGLNKQAVQQLADELFKLPPSVSTTVNVDTSAATNNLDSLYSLIDQLQGAGSTLSNSLDVTAAKQAGKLGGAKASGGPVEQGVIYHVNESGAEGFFVPPANGYIIPHEQFASIGAGVGPAASSSGFASGGGGGQPQVTVHVYLDGREISAEMRAEVQGYANHNGFTGFETTASRISR